MVHGPRDEAELATVLGIVVASHAYATDMRRPLMPVPPLSGGTTTGAGSAVVRALGLEERFPEVALLRNARGHVVDAKVVRRLPQ